MVTSRHIMFSLFLLASVGSAQAFNPIDFIKRTCARCSCQNPRPRSDNDERCGCNKPRDTKESSDERCGCNKPRDTKESDERCGCNKPRDTKESSDERCGCNKPRDTKESDERCGCNKPRETKESSDERCGCNKPKSDGQEINRNEIIHCACANHQSQQPRAVAATEQQPALTIMATDGGMLFIQTTTHFLDILKGSILANNWGKLSVGLPYIVNGIQGLATMIAQSRNPKETAEHVADFLATINEQEFKTLLMTARS